MIEGLEVDAVWRVERAVLEFDSYEFHATRAAFKRDRRRDAIPRRFPRPAYDVARAHAGAVRAVARIAESLSVARAGDRVA